MLYDCVAETAALNNEETGLESGGSSNTNVVNNYTHTHTYEDVYAMLCPCSQLRYQIAFLVSGR